MMDLSGYQPQARPAPSTPEDDPDRTDREQPEDQPGDELLWPQEPLPTPSLVVQDRNDGPSRLRRMLVPGESIVIAQRQHAIVILEPVLTSVAGLVVAGWISGSLGDLNLARGALFIGWFLLVLRAVARIWDWQVHWFLVTDRRLLMSWGIVSRKVGMLPMRKVTDMAYERSVLGRLVGYGTFVMESAGQDQALRRVDYVAYPDENYVKICHLLFGPRPGRDDEG